MEGPDVRQLQPFLLDFVFRLQHCTHYTRCTRGTAKQIAQKSQLDHILSRETSPAAMTDDAKSTSLHPPFKLERYFDKYEHHVKHLACASDCEGLTLGQVLDMATPSQKETWANLKLSYTHTRGGVCEKNGTCMLFTSDCPFSPASIHNQACQNCEKQLQRCTIAHGSSTMWTTVSHQAM